MAACFSLFFGVLAEVSLGIVRRAETSGFLRLCVALSGSLAYATYPSSLFLCFSRKVCYAVLEIRLAHEGGSYRDGVDNAED